MKGVIASICYPRQSPFLWRSKIANMSRGMNEGVMMRCKAVMKIIFNVVVPPPKPNQLAIAVPDITLHTSLYIR